MHTHTQSHKELAEEEMNFDPAGHSHAEVIAGLHSCVSHCVCVSPCVCMSVLYCLFVRVRVETTGVWPLLSYPQGWILSLCVCVCADHLVGTVANFSIRHTHTIFSICPKGQALFIHYCAPVPVGCYSSSGRCRQNIIAGLAQVTF